jgi:hypothetical protein
VILRESKSKSIEPESGIFSIPIEDLERLRKRRAVVISIAKEVLEGGLGSGHWGHKGRPGMVGGSTPSGHSLSQEVGKKPSTKFQKQYARMVEFEGRRIWQFPGKYGSPDEGKKISIPKEIRLSGGVKPGDDEFKKIVGAWRAAKSELGYSHIQDIVDLTGMDKESVHKAIIYLIKNQKAIGNVDRWGNLVFVKIKKD